MGTLHGAHAHADRTVEGEAPRGPALRSRVGALMGADRADASAAQVGPGERERELEDSVALLKATLESTADGIIVTDCSGKVVLVNQRFKSLWHLSDDVTVQDAEHGIALLVAQLSDPVGFEARVRELLERPESEGDDVLEFKDGRVFERRYRPQRRAGVIVGRVWSFRDITEQRQLQASLASAERLASMGLLAAGVAHEINNPLAYVIANLSVLVEEIPALAAGADKARLDEALQMLKDVREGAERVRRVVRDLKLFSRSDEMTTGPVDLRPVLDFTIEMAQNEIRHRARLVKDYGVDLPLVEGNEGKLGQVFLNLLVNAAHSIPEGRIEQNEIRVVTRVDEKGRVVVEIRDTGEGIPPDRLPRIFVPFFTTKAIGFGTGLGLSTSHGIVTALGGSIQVKSEVGKGSVFRVVLPVVARAPATVPLAKASEPALALQRGRVLVVDDDPMVAAVVRRVLGREHDVVVATSGRAALEHLHSAERVDVILCDLMMPEMTGMDLHEQLARVRPGDAQSMVFLSGGAFTSRAREFLERVPNERFEKPFDLGAMRSLVRRFVATRTARRI
jgi:PAS domain S-box-containing protein